MSSSGQYRKMGLHDKNVIKCDDRGENDYNKKYPLRIDPAGVPYHRHCAHKSNKTARMKCDLKEASQNHLGCEHGEIVGLIKCELGESRVRNPPDSNSKYFIPRHKLQTIITPCRIRQVIETLGSCQKLSDTEKDKLRDQICVGDKQCWKLLAVLLMANKQKDIMALVREGASDRCLPFGVNGSSCCVGHNHPTIRSWKSHTLDEASRWSYAVKAPYFTRHRGKHNHYILDSNDVLPILPIDELTSDASATPHSTDENNNIVDGGFGQVTKVVLDESHYNFENLGLATWTQSGGRPQFALKQLHMASRETFNQELASLKAFQDRDDKHLIKLLATLEVKKARTTTYYLLFPWAEGNLWEFWERHADPKSRFDRCLWMAEQIYQLAQALMLVHNERLQQLKEMKDTIDESKQELYGRHGDIKADNILWFGGSNEELVLADFGLGRLNSKYSRSGVNPKLVDKSATYRAPEFDLSGGTISRRSDIFSFGCMCLEFVTWYLEGWEAVSDKFPEYRLEADIHNQNADIFFTIEEYKTEEERAIIKPKVIQWIDRLKGSRACSSYILQFLELIEERMLDPDSSQRIKSPELVKKLELLSDKLKTGELY